MARIVLEGFGARMATRATPS